jgi:GNAT superfamily N-acetyltransferase
MTRFNIMDVPLSNYLNEFRFYYPDILEWYSRLQSDLLTGRRNLFAICRRSTIEGLAITKNGAKAKLCHISVVPSARNRGIGGSLIRLALANMKSRGAKEIHVTTDEKIFRQFGEFFRSAGFSIVDWQVNRYRSGSSELLWTMPVTASCKSSLSNEDSIGWCPKRLKTPKLLYQGWPSTSLELARQRVTTGRLHGSIYKHSSEFVYAAELELGGHRSLPAASKRSAIAGHLVNIQSWHNQ